MEDFMKEILKRIRTPDKNMKIENKILNTILFFLLGIILGLFSFGFDGFKDFILTTFIEINKIKPFLDEYAYPRFDKSSFFLQLFLSC